MVTVRRAGATVLVGSAAGFSISFLLTPLLSRIYDPEVFGTYSTLVAVASTFVGISTFRLEALSLGVESDDEAAGLRVLALRSASAWSAAFVAIGLVAWMFGQPLMWVSLGGMVFAGSLQLIGSARLVRQTRYRHLAFANFGQGASMGVLQGGLGVASPSAWSLISGFAISRLVWLGWPLVRTRRDPIPPRWRDFRRVRRAALISGTSALVNSAASSLPILLTALFYGQAQVGLLAIVVRVLVSPLGIVGDAAASANIGECGRLLRQHDPEVERMVRRGMRDLLLVGSLPCVVLAAVSIPLTPVLLGEQWKDAGPILATLTVGALAQFVVAPFSQLMILTGHTARQFQWDLARFVTIAFAIGLPAAWNAPYAIGIVAYSVALVALYAALARLILRAVGMSVK